MSLRVIGVDLFADDDDDIDDIRARIEVIPHAYSCDERTAHHRPACLMRYSSTVYSFGSARSVLRSRYFTRVEMKLQIGDLDDGDAKRAGGATTLRRERALFEAKGLVT